MANADFGPLYDDLQKKIAARAFDALTEKELLVMLYIEMSQMRKTMSQPPWTTWGKRDVVVGGSIAVALVTGQGAAVISLLKFLGAG